MSSPTLHGARTQTRSWSSALISTRCPRGQASMTTAAASSTILEIAEEMAELKYTKKLQRQVRFAFWGAEENNLLGLGALRGEPEPRRSRRRSTPTSTSTWSARRTTCASSTTVMGRTDPRGLVRPGRMRSSKIFTEYFESQGLASRADGVRRPVRLRSVHRRPAFRPVACSAARRGSRLRSRPRSTAARPVQPYDPCYHEACDDINNLSTKALFEMGDAAAHAVWVLAKSKTGLFPDGSRVGPQAKAAPQELYQEGSRRGALTGLSLGDRGPLSLLARSIRRAAQRSTRVRIPTPWSAGCPTGARRVRP